MVRNLVNNGANLIWEHSLSDAGQMKSGIRKPNPKDPLQYVHIDFSVYTLIDKSHFLSLHPSQLQHLLKLHSPMLSLKAKF